MGVIAFLCGVGFGVCVSAIVWLALQPRRRPLPPATRKQIARAARANRAELDIIRGADRRNWLPPSIDDFDDKDTQ